MFSSARRSTPLAVFALCLLLTLPSDVRAQASGSLTGVVVPDLPPEVSPGEEISFTPPSGSEGGTWTLCGVVAEPAEDSEQPPEAERPRPAAAQVGLKPDPALKPLSEAQALGLALASAMNEPSWAACLSGRPSQSVAGDHPAAAGDPMPDVDVALEKKIGGYAARILLTELTGEQVSGSDQAVADLRESLAETGSAVRYFGAALEDVAGGTGCSFCKSFFESRSNTANRTPTAAGFSISRPDRNVLITSVDALPDRNEPWPVVVAVAMGGMPAMGKEKGTVMGKGGNALTVAFAPVQCQSPPMTAQSASRARHDTAKSAIQNIKALVVTVPADYKPGQRFPVSFRDASGRTVLNVDNVESVHVVPPRPRPADPRPSLDAAPEYVIAGQSVCACGYFPDSRSRSALLFDELAVQPVSASSRMAILPLSATVTPGRHRISGDRTAGFSDKVLYTNVVQVNGRLDANSLRRGQATQMELIVVGTDQPLALKIVNSTPQVISIGGRAEQTLTTSGGNPNHLVQTVNSLKPGNFGIDFSLAADRCPCQEPTR